jgi:hypothetical protein
VGPQESTFAFIFIAIGGPKGCGYWGVPNVKKTIEDGLNIFNMAYKKEKRKSCGCTHELI